MNERKPNAIITPVTILAVAVLPMLFAMASLLMTALSAAEYFELGFFRRLGIHPTAFTLIGAVAYAGLWIAVSIALLRYRRRLQRQIRGDCLRCGYSLTGNTSGICPECGARVGERTPRGYWLRRMHFVVAVISLMLFAATVVLWIRSYSGADWVTIGVPQKLSTDCETWEFLSNSGLVRVGRQNGDFVYSDGYQYRRAPGFEWTGLITPLQRHGFSFDSAKNYQQAGRHTDYVTVVVPWWTVATVAIVLPLSWVIPVARRRKRS